MQLSLFGLFIPISVTLCLRQNKTLDVNNMNDVVNVQTIVQLTAKAFKMHACFQC